MNELIPFNVVTVAEVPDRFHKIAIAVGEALKDLPGPEAFELVDQEISRSKAFLHGSTLYTCFLIGQQKVVWDKMGLDEQHGIATSFYEYVAKKLNIEQSASTIDNYVHVAKVWLIEDTKIDVPEKVFHFDVVDGKVQFVVDKDDQAYEVPTDVWEGQYSKFLVATSRAAKDKMEEEDWGLLFNPNVSQGKLLSYWRGPRKDPTPGLTFVLISGWLAVSDGDEVAALAEMDMDEIDNKPLAKQGWDRLRAVLQLQEEDDF